MRRIHPADAAGMTRLTGLPRGAGVLITGASAGIGAALARAMAAALAGSGVRLLLTGRNIDRLQAVGRAVGAQTLAIDLAVPGAGSELARRAIDALGRVDVLINNAGIGAAGPTATTPAAVDRLVAVNLTAPIQLTQALLPTLLERGSGQLVFVGSIAGSLGVRDEAVYSATKAGIAIFAESLRQEVRSRGIGVTLVVPGVVDTGFFRSRGSTYDRRRPRPIPAERVAAAIVHGLRSRSEEIVVPRWLVVPSRLHGATPALYRRLAGRWG